MVGLSKTRMTPCDELMVATGKSERNIRDALRDLDAVGSSAPDNRMSWRLPIVEQKPLS